MSAANFPHNMPAVWRKHWGRIPSATGVALLLGEWGGIWHSHDWNGNHFKATRKWQLELTAYLVQQGVGFFYWTLNDNSFRTGSLFSDYTGASDAKLRMLNATPTTLMRELSEAVL